MILEARQPTILQRVYDAMRDGEFAAHEIASGTRMKLQAVKQAIRTLRKRGIIECTHSAPSYRLIPEAIRPIDGRGRK